MSSSKSININSSITSKKKISTPKMIKEIIEKNKNVIELKKKLKNNGIRCKLLLYTFNKLNKQIDDFQDLYGELDEATQVELIDKLDRETKFIFEKYKECSKTDDELYDNLNELITKIYNKYDIVDSSTPILYTYKTSGRGIKTKNNRKNRMKKNKRIRTKNKK
tara:strand:- start:255 stop:746 length:492 start_codon:yes stop_codon:yes gene_type:complete